MKKLRDAVVGDKILVKEAHYNNRGRAPETLHTVTKVNRTNLIASDGRLWNRDHGHQPSDVNAGSYAASVEAWDEDVHPFREEFLRAQQLLTQLNDVRQYLYRDRSRKFAAALPYLKLAAKELGLEVPE
jgi:hypothetical protein